MNRLDALKIFCSAAETLQFKETAQRLGVSPQVVTRTIGELERELGEVLFQRSTRQVQLSDFGEQFLPQAQQLLYDSERLFATAHHAADAQMSGVVRVAVPDMLLMEQILADVWVALADYPHISLDWRTGLALADVVDERIDVGIRFGTPEDSRLIVKRLGWVEECVVAAPALLERLGIPQNWADLQRNYPLSALLNPNTGRIWPWYLSDSMQLIPYHPKFITTRIENELVSALAGQTVACLPRMLCRPHLRSGALAELFADAPRKRWPAYVYRPQRNVTHPRVKRVFDVLADCLGKRLEEAGTIQEGEDV